MKMGQFREVDPEEQKRCEEEKLRKQQEEEAHVAAMKAGDRYKKRNVLVNFIYYIRVYSFGTCSIICEAVGEYQIKFIWQHRYTMYKIYKWILNSVLVYETPQGVEVCAGLNRYESG
jgi:hypothetical protein